VSSVLHPHSSILLFAPRPAGPAYCGNNVAEFEDGFEPEFDDRFASKFVVRQVVDFVVRTCAAVLTFV
jgi:hypothetical protein